LLVRCVIVGWCRRTVRVMTGLHRSLTPGLTISRRPTVRTRPIPREPNMPASQRLIEEIVAAGGSLRVPRRSWYSRTGQPDYERRVAAAERRGAVPTGKRLVVTYDRDELQIDLRDAPKGTPTQAFPVRVPERVGKYHPIVAEFRDPQDRQE